MNNCSGIEEFFRMVTSNNDPIYLLKLWDDLQYSYKSFMGNEKGQSTLIKYANKLISCSDNERKGLMLLNTILLSCSTSLVMENTSSWTTMCTTNSTKEVALKLRILAKLIRICGGKPEFDKIINSAMGKMIDTCISINLNETMCEDALDTLYVCLEKYPNICGPFYNKLENYTQKYFTVQLSPTIIKKAGNVFHMLQQAGGLPVTHKTNWSKQISKLCTTVHKLYDRFLLDINEFDSYHDFNVTPFSLPLEHGHLNTFIILRNVLIFINSMLLERFPSEKVINVGQILDVIKRGLLVDIFQEANDSLKKSKFVALLYELHINLFNLLRSLIACFKQLLFRFISRITKLIIDCLQRTQKDYFKNRSHYQKAIYKTLKLWISINKNKLPSSTHNKLISIILTDITIIKSNVILRLNERISKNGSAKPDVQDEKVLLNLNKTELSQHLLDTKATICVQALYVGCVLLEQCVLKLHKNTYKLLFEAVVQQLMEIQSGKVLHPYNNLKCQTLLYKMLVALFMQPDYCTTCFMHIGITIFTRGQSTTNNKISNICNEGLNTLEKLCQAPNPTLCINNMLDEISSSRHQLQEFQPIINTIDADNLSSINLEIKSDDETPNISINRSIASVEEVCDINDTALNDEVSKPNHNISTTINVEDEEIIQEEIINYSSSGTPDYTAEYTFSDPQRSHNISKTNDNLNSNSNLKRTRSDMEEDEEFYMIHSFKDILK